MIDPRTIPLALYVHIPWCVRKCPYCDFNSHEAKGSEKSGGGLPEREYVAALLADLRDESRHAYGRRIETVFFGGGTPSLFSPDAIQAILDGADSIVPFTSDAEVTMEANPGTIEHGRFDGYRDAGVNRVSFGVQSFDDAKLRALGRIHGANEARDAVRQAQDAGIARINVDLMYALPQQAIEGALADVEAAIALAPTHVSHYQLTLEPNTLFAARPPPLPEHDDAWTMQEACQARLADAGFAQYEVSAYARGEHERCRHNLNYWAFGDYLGIGAGAHAKLTRDDGAIVRRWKKKLPRSYLDGVGALAHVGGEDVLDAKRLPFEFALNAFRLHDGFALADYAARTGDASGAFETIVADAARDGFVEIAGNRVRPTEQGRNFLNDLLERFLP